MDKQLLIILISIITYLPVLGQDEPRPLDKGQNYIGLIGFINHDDYSNYFFYSSVRYGRFVLNKFAIGANVNFQGYSESNLSKLLVFVPFARYYFLNKKISPVVEFHYSYTIKIPNEPYNERYYPSTSTFNLGAGIAFNRILWNRFGAEVVMFYGHSNYLQHDDDYWTIEPMLYLTYHFPK